MQNKKEYDKIFNEMMRTKEDQEKMKQELKRAKEENEHLRNKMNQKEQELGQEKEENEQTRNKINLKEQELKCAKEENEQLRNKINLKEQELINAKEKNEQMRNKMNQKEQELRQEKEENEQLRNKMNQKEQESKNSKEEFEQLNNKHEKEREDSNQKKIENKQCTYMIMTSGFDSYILIGKPNNKNLYNAPIIHPPQESPIDFSSLLSYSVCYLQSVIVTNNGLIKGAGNNECGHISDSLPRMRYSEFTEFVIKGCENYVPISAVCYYAGTLYMFSESNFRKRHLVLCDSCINEYPVSLFGGYSNTAVITDKGEIILIITEEFMHKTSEKILAISLPDEKALSVACCNDKFYSLSSKGRVFMYNIQSGRSFSLVQELAKKEIVSLSGTNEHCIAVSKEGSVFVVGSNYCGVLGLGKEVKSVSSFTEVSSLSGYKITYASAGHFHSLFQTNEGKILSCGGNFNGALLLNNELGNDIYLPRETTITSGSSFCFAERNISIAFIGCNPPQNMPNQQIQYEK